MQESSAVENQILQLVSGRIRTLLENIQDSATLDHTGTVGSVRERHIREFLALLLPAPLAITSGFIVDPHGRRTPQLDLIVYDPTRIPPIALPGDVSVVPSDSALLVGEIKSMLSVETLHQVQRQLAAIEKMSHSGESTNEQASLIVPQVIVAFNSALSHQTLDTWFAQCSNLLLISVLQSATLAKVGTDQRLVTLGGEPSYAAIRALVVHFFSVLHQVTQLRRAISPRLAHYLMPEWRAAAG